VLVTTTEQSYTNVSVTVAGLSIRVMQGGDGPRAVWLHHSTGPIGWLPVHDRLAQSFQISAPDLPGFGQSERPAWARHPRDVAILLGRAIARLDLGPVLLIGHGFGGWIAAELATMNPSALSGLVLVGAAGLRPDEGEITDQIFFGFEDYIKQGFRDDAAFHDLFGDDGANDRRELWDFSREMTTRLTWKPWMFNRQLAQLLPEVDVPALVVWGGEDRVVPLACGKQYVAALPNARLEVVPHAGHLVELEEPDALATLITEFAGA